MNIALRFHIHRQLILWSCVLALGYGVIASTVYLWGIDDATEYYMLKEAKRESVRIMAGHPTRAQPFSDFASYYLGYENLPASLQAQFPKDQLTPNHSAFFQDAQYAVYLLPYIIKHRESPPSTLYVVHRYDAQDDDLQPGMPLPELLLLLTLSTLVLAYIASSFLVRSITLPLFALLDWAQSLKAASPRALSPADQQQLRFSEFTDIAEQLYLSVKAVMRSNEREKQYLNATSHEIRTPLSVIFAALDLLEKTDFAAPVQHKLLKIRHASMKIKHLSESLLWLWRDEHLPLEVKDNDLLTLSQGIIEDSIVLYPSVSHPVHCDIDPTVCINANPALLEIAIGNLVRNALAHTVPGTITISGNADHLTVTNTIADVPAHPGFNLGLYLVNAIADKQGWHLNTQHEENHFCATLYWSPAHTSDVPNVEVPTA